MIQHMQCLVFNCKKILTCWSGVWVVAFVHADSSEISALCVGSILHSPHKHVVRVIGLLNAIAGLRKSMDFSVREEI